MRLNHLNLYVDDLTEATRFFQDVFDFRLLEQKEKALAVLADDGDFTLVLSDRHAFGAAEPTRYPDPFHIGFLLEAPDDVDAAYDRAEAAGVPLDHRPRRVRGTYTFYFEALNAILVEVGCPLRRVAGGQ